MDRAKLAELRGKKLAQKAEQEKAAHTEILESQGLIAKAVHDLHTILNDQKPYDDGELIQQIKELKKSLTFSTEIEKIEKAIQALPKVDSVKVSNFEALIKSVDSIKLDNSAVVGAVNSLANTIEINNARQYPEDFIPTRRVRKVGGQLIFDDDPMTVNVTGGGGGGSFPSQLIRNGDTLAVVNPDGSNISGGGGSGGDASAANQDEQTAILEEIRDNTADISIDADTINLNTDQLEAKLDTLNAKDFATSAKQLPNNHNVVVTSAPTTAVTGPLTDTQLRATPVPVSGTVTSTPSGTQTVAISQTGTNNDVDATVTNFPSEYPLPTSQVTTLTPPAAITGFATAAKQDDIIDAIGGVPRDLIAGVDFDYLDVQQTSDVVETYTKKLGGTGGTNIETTVITYAAADHNIITSVAWS